MLTKYLGPGRRHLRRATGSTKAKATDTRPLGARRGAALIRVRAKFLATTPGEGQASNREGTENECGGLWNAGEVTGEYNRCIGHEWKDLWIASDLESDRSTAQHVSHA